MVTIRRVVKAENRSVEDTNLAKIRGSLTIQDSIGNKCTSPSHAKVISPKQSMEESGEDVRGFKLKDRTLSEMLERICKLQHESSVWPSGNTGSFGHEASHIVGVLIHVN